MALLKSPLYRKRKDKEAHDKAGRCDLGKRISELEKYTTQNPVQEEILYIQQIEEFISTAIPIMA
jgi:hypothetical protein